MRKYARPYPAPASDPQAPRNEKGGVREDAARPVRKAVSAYILFQVCDLQKIFSAQPVIFIAAPVIVADPE